MLKQSAFVAAIAVSFISLPVTHDTTMKVVKTIKLDIDAKPFVPEFSEADYKCLATTIYGEARGESLTGMIAVGYTAKNRYNDIRFKEETICDIVLADYQYSVFNGNEKMKFIAQNLDATPKFKDIHQEAAWEFSKLAAKLVLQGKAEDVTNGATFYLAPKAMKKLKYKLPRWAKEYEYAATVGGHKFYINPI